MKLIVLLMGWSILVFGYPMIPDKSQTWGELCDENDNDFEEYRYDEQIPYCHRNVASALKTRIYDEYEIPKSERKSYTIDHLIPLSIGGDNHHENLWPEHKEVKALRPNLEMEIYVAVRDGKMRQKDAVETILEEKFNPIHVQRRMEMRLKAMSPTSIVSLVKF